MPRAGAPASTATRERRYRIWRSAVRVTTNDEEVLGALDRLCRQFAAEQSESAQEFHVERTAADAWALSRNGTELEIRRTALQAALRLEWHLVRAAVQAERHYIHIHGAALTQNGRTILIPGASGIGKSTLSLALAAAGFELLGDDVVFIDPESGAVHPFPRAPHIHDDAVPRLVSAGFHYRPELHIGPYLEADAVTNWRRTPAPPLSSVLFVEWDRDGPVEIVPRTQAETAIELVRVSHNLREWPGAGLPALRRVLKPTESFQILRGQDLAAAIAAVREIIRTTRPAGGSVR